MNNRIDLTEDKISTLIFKLAIPIIFTNIFSMLFEIVDAIFIGKINSEALAGISIAGSIHFFISTFMAGIGIGTVALVSRYCGAKKYENANEVSMQAFIIGLFLGILISIFGFIFSADLLKIMGAKDKVFNYALPYNKILFSGAFLMPLLFLGSAILRGSGDTKTPMYFSLMATFLNIFLDWTLIFGKLGFPRLEVKGAAIATIISRGLASILLIFILTLGKHNIHLNLKKIKISFDIIKKIFSIGIMASIQMFVRSSSSLFLVKLSTLFGTPVIASYGIGGKVYQIFLLPGFGFADASATMVGHNLGANSIKRAKKTVLTAISYYLVFNFIFGLLVFFFPEKIAKIFNNETLVIKTCSVYLKFLSIGGIFLSFGLIISRSLQGAGESFIPMLNTIIALLLIQIPLAYFLSINLKLKELGIWTAMPVANIIHSILMLFAFFKTNWHNKRII